MGWTRRMTNCCWLISGNSFILLLLFGFILPFLLLFLARSRKLVFVSTKICPHLRYNWEWIMNLLLQVIVFISQFAALFFQWLVFLNDFLIHIHVLIFTLGLLMEALDKIENLFFMLRRQVVGQFHGFIGRHLNNNNDVW